MAARKKKIVREATKLAVGYIRVSTQEQKIHGISLEMQEDRIRAYCSFHGLELLTVIRDEGVSGTIPLYKRPGGSQLRGLGESGVQHVITLKLDRMFRNAENCLRTVGEFDEEQISFHLVDLGGQALDTRSAMGRFFLTMMAAFAEMERNVISERTSQALQHKAAQGMLFGHVRLGFTTTNPKTCKDMIERDMRTVARILVLRKHHWSYRKICAWLQEQGYKPRKGTVWHPPAIRSVCSFRRGYENFMKNHASTIHADMNPSNLERVFGLTENQIHWKARRRHKRKEVAA